MGQDEEKDEGTMEEVKKMSEESPNKGMTFDKVGSPSRVASKFARRCSKLDKDLRDGSIYVTSSALREYGLVPDMSSYPDPPINIDIRDNIEFPEVDYTRIPAFSRNLDPDTLFAGSAAVTGAPRSEVTCDRPTQRARLNLPPPAMPSAADKTCWDIPPPPYHGAPSPVELLTQSFGQWTGIHENLSAQYPEGAPNPFYEEVVPNANEGWLLSYKSYLYMHCAMR